MNQTEKVYPPFESPAFLKGYRDGYELEDNRNPYVELSPEWVDYENGWEEGWLDA